MPNIVIDVKDLKRKYKVKVKKEKVEKVALKGISFDVKKGEVFGLLGPNGAGKSTTMKILSTLLSPSSGTVKIFNLDVEKNAKKLRKELNYVFGGEKGVYGRLTGLEYMNYFAALYKIPKKKRAERIKELIALVDLVDAKDRGIFTYSKGMIQRLHVARSLLNEPKIIFMDEPTIGLDPAAANKLREIIQDLANKGVTILLTTHYMYEAENLCDRIAMINDGEIKMLDTPSNLKRDYNTYTHYEVSCEIYDYNKLEDLKNIDKVKINIKRVTESILVFNIKSKELKCNDIMFLLKDIGKILSMEEKDATLEDVYLEMIGE